MFKLASIALFAIVALFLASSLPATTARAATSSLNVTQKCSGSVIVNFSWAGNDSSSQQQWIDLSLSDNGWQAGTFLSAGPLSGSTTSYEWSGLQGSATHFVRVNQQISTGAWDPSATFMFTTISCVSSPSPPATASPTQNNQPLPRCVGLPTAGLTGGQATILPGDSPFLGIWSGSWKTPGFADAASAFVVRSVSSTGVDASYFFNNSNQGGTFQLNADGTITTTPNNGVSFTWSVSGETLTGKRFFNGQQTSTVAMTRCSP